MYIHMLNVEAMTWEIITYQGSCGTQNPLDHLEVDYQTGSMLRLTREDVDCSESKSKLERGTLDRLSAGGPCVQEPPTLSRQGAGLDCKRQGSDYTTLDCIIL